MNTRKPLMGLNETIPSAQSTMRLCIQEIESLCKADAKLSIEFSKTVFGDSGQNIVINQCIHYFGNKKVVVVMPDRVEIVDIGALDSDVQLYIREFDSKQEK